MLGTGIWFGLEAPLSIAFGREIGAARRRVEDPRLVRGAGQFVDNLRLPGTVDVAFVRSGYAHARIKRVDLEAADRSLSLRLDHSRVAQVPMEPRAVLASNDRQADVLTVWCSTRVPSATRAGLSVVLRRPEESIRVIAPHVGGAFGAKSALYPDEIAVALLALGLAVPVRRVSTRFEDFQMTMHGRDQVHTVEAAFTNDGIITALKTRSVCNFGAFTLATSAAPPIRMPNYATGAYRSPALRSEVFAVYTNTPPNGPYRGAGRPEAAFLAERVAEEVARTLGLDPVEVRRRNCIRPDQFPYTTPNGAVYDSGDYEKPLDRALEIVGYRELRERQRRERGTRSPLPLGEGRGEGAGGDGLLGIGIATTIEVSAQGWESGRIEVEPDGAIVARTGSSSHGQGHETSFAQVVADRLQVTFENVRLVHGDTAQIPVGVGTFGSRSLAVGGGALAVSAEEVVKQAIQVASWSRPSSWTSPRPLRPTTRSASLTSTCR